MTAGIRGGSGVGRLGFVDRQADFFLGWNSYTLLHYSDVGISGSERRSQG